MFNITHYWVSEVAQSCPTLCDPMDCSLTRLLRPWDFPGKNTGVGCHFLLQEIFPTQGLNPGFPHCRQMLYHLSHQGRSLSEKCKSKLRWGITLHWSEWPSSESQQNNKCWRGCGEKGALLHCWWECKLMQPLCRTVWRFLKKTTIWPRNPTTRHTP